MFHGRYTHKKDFEQFVHEMSVKLVKSAIRHGYNIIIDETNITQKRRENWIDIIKKEGISDIKVTYVWFTEMENNLKNRMIDPKGVNSKKWGAIINSMKKRFEPPSDKELFDEIIKIDKVDQDSKEYKKIIQNMNLPKAIIVDLDGTLAKLNGRDPYDASTCDKDEINYSISSIVDRFIEDEAYTIIFCTGRPEQYREPTMRFLKKCGYVYDDYSGKKDSLKFLDSIGVKLFMRKDNDFRKDSTIKKEIFDEHIKDKYYVEFCLDDRDSIVGLWRGMGLTCLQVDYGKF